MLERIRRPLLLVALGLVCVIWALGVFRAEPGHHRSESGLVDSSPAEIPRSTPTADDPDANTPELPAFSHTCSANANLVSVRRDTPYQRKHVRPASKLPGTRLIPEMTVLDELLRSGTFVQVDHGEGYVVGHEFMTHSHPVLHARAAAVLEQLGQAYLARVQGGPYEGSALLLSSMTRTSEQQGSLDDIGKSPLSAHSYGAAFDVAGIRVMGGPGCGHVRRVLGEVLNDFRKAGTVRLLPENDCLHVTVLPEPPGENRAEPSAAAAQGEEQER